MVHALGCAPLGVRATAVCPFVSRCCFFQYILEATSLVKHIFPRWWVLPVFLHVSDPLSAGSHFSSSFTHALCFAFMSCQLAEVSGVLIFNPASLTMYWPREFFLVRHPNPPLKLVFWIREGQHSASLRSLQDHGVGPILWARFWCLRTILLGFYPSTGIVQPNNHVETKKNQTFHNGVKTAPSCLRGNNLLGGGFQYNCILLCLAKRTLTWEALNPHGTQNDTPKLVHFLLRIALQKWPWWPYIPYKMLISDPTRVDFWNKKGG